MRQSPILETIDETYKNVQNNAQSKHLLVYLKFVVSLKLGSAIVIFSGDKISPSLVRCRRTIKVTTEMKPINFTV